MTPEEWNNIVAINLTGVFNFTKLVIPYMVADKCGRILQISSVWGNVGASCEVAYSACKGGINAFTKALGNALSWPMKFLPDALPQPVRLQIWLTPSSLHLITSQDR